MSLWRSILFNIEMEEEKGITIGVFLGFPVA